MREQASLVQVSYKPRTSLVHVSYTSRTSLALARFVYSPLFVFSHMSHPICHTPSFPYDDEREHASLVLPSFSLSHMSHPIFPSICHPTSSSCSAGGEASTACGSSFGTRTRMITSSIRMRAMMWAGQRRAGTAPSGLQRRRCSGCRRSSMVSERIFGMRSPRLVPRSAARLDASFARRPAALRAAALAERVATLGRAARLVTLVTNAARDRVAGGAAGAPAVAVGGKAQLRIGLKVHLFSDGALTLAPFAPARVNTAPCQHSPVSTQPLCVFSMSLLFFFVTSYPELRRCECGGRCGWGAGGARTSAIGRTIETAGSLHQRGGARG